ncbi:MAG: hypothetical protein KDE53_26150 [Caldilineaceae bacterium]|nr:hypothetical protein [Caldilineaceae bacterium]MCB0184845.1 hypothetical protein [Caldilineaceae bacterium]
MSIARPKCPNCGTPITWNRFLLNRSIWSRWPCTGCGQTLKFTWQRGLLYGLALLALIIVLNPIGFALMQITGLSIYLIAVVIYLPLALLLLLLIDRVVLA